MRDEYNVRNIAASYKFDESYEMNIYKYLCCRKMKKKIKEKISHTVSIPLRQVIICNWIEKPGSF